MPRTPLSSLSLLLFFGVALGLQGCDNHAKDKSQASVSAPLAEGAQGAVTESCPIGPDNSKVEFVGAKISMKHNGSFGAFKGSIDLAGDKIESARVKVEIEMASVTTDAEKLTGHLKTPDLFDVAAFPKATFVSTEVKPGGDKGATHTITGNLELHGVKKSISFPATVTLAPDAVSAKSEFVLKRKDFGITYPGKPDDLISEDVVIKLTLKAPRKKS